MDRIGVAVVGTGFGAQVHLPGFLAVPGYEVVAICSATKSRAEAVAERFGIGYATTDYAELIARDDVDLVSIASPPHLHHTMTLQAIEAGKHVLCEKPLARDVGEAREMLNAARERERVHAVVHEMRYFPEYRELGRLVQEGFIGRLRFLVVSVYTNMGVDPRQPLFYDSWRAERKHGGGLTSGILSHHFDLACVWFGDIAEVFAHTETLVGTRPLLAATQQYGERLGAGTEVRGERPVETDDTALVTGRFRAGGVFSISGSWSVHHGSGTRLEVYGDEGTLVVDASSSLSGARGTDKQLERIAPAEVFALPEGTRGMVGAFAKLVSELQITLRGESDKTSYATFEDGLRVQEVIDAVRVDSSEGWTRLPSY